jgi:hypothetical protein
MWLIGLNPDVLKWSSVFATRQGAGRERMHFSLEVAVAKFWRLQGGGAG